MRFNKALTLGLIILILFMPGLPSVADHTFDNYEEVIDVMVLFTPSARSVHGSDTAIRAFIDLSIADTNTAYRNSDIRQRVRLVHAEEVLYRETRRVTDLLYLQDPFDGYIDNIHVLRDRYGADLVSLFIDTSAEFCGIGYVMTSITGITYDFAPWAFSVVASDCRSTVLAHEMGHNMGCQHNRENSDFPGLYHDSYGHRPVSFHGDSWHQYRTIMAYPPGNEILHFSNPMVIYDNAPTGVSNKANNARTINNTRSIVTSFKPSNLLANAGPDQEISDRGTRGEYVTLDGTRSLPYGRIPTYEWRVDGNLIATGPKPTIFLSSMGTYDIELTIITDAQQSDTDVFRITILDNILPTLLVEREQVILDVDRNGTESVTLDASRSYDPDGYITSFAWQVKGVTLATGPKAALNLNVGEHTILLVAWDNGNPAVNFSPGVVSTTIQIVIKAPLRVPFDFKTIQAAIDSAKNGDIVLVADGMYTGQGNRDINFRGKAITVKSMNGPTKTIIDAQGSETNPHQGFLFATWEDNSSVLDGFTITGCFTVETGRVYNHGAAIGCVDSSPTIRNNIIIGNSTSESGGGISCRDGNPIIINNTITKNSADNGGGIAITGRGYPVISGNVITANNAYSGGGIDCQSSRVFALIEGNIISDNSAPFGGGGVFFRYSEDLTFRNNFVSNNTSFGHGVGYGGGVSVFYGNPVMLNNVIAHNRSSFGGGIYCHQSFPWISSNTITENSAIRGDGIYCSESSPRIANCIIYGNISLNSISLYMDMMSFPHVTYSNIQGGWFGTGNIDNNPLFVDAQNGNYRLGPSSPCIDAGNGSMAPVLDKDGNHRYDYPNVQNTGGGIPNITDIGAYELVGPLAITTTSLPGGKEGENYLQRLTAGGGSGGGYVWKIVSGSLPIGLTLDTFGTPSAAISGVPIQTGTFYFTVQVRDSNSSVAEKGVSIYIAPGPRDLAITAIYGDSNGWYNWYRNHRAVIKNNGTGISPFSSLAIYLSSDATLDSTDTYVGSYSVGQIYPGQEAVIRYAFRIPSTWPNFTVNVIAVLDRFNYILETNETNNKKHRAVGLTIFPENINGDRDANGRDIIDTTDIVLVSQAYQYGKIPGTLQWNSCADVWNTAGNRPGPDGQIDTLDIARVLDAYMGRVTPPTY